MKIREKGAATQFTSADADAADQFRFIAHTNLAHFNAGMEMVGEILDQFAKIDPAIGREIENDFRAVKQVFGLDQFHRHVALTNALHAVVKGFFFLGRTDARHIVVGFSGQAQDFFQIPRGRSCLATL